MRLWLEILALVAIAALVGWLFWELGGYWRARGPRRRR